MGKCIFNLFIALTNISPILIIILSKYISEKFLFITSTYTYLIVSIVLTILLCIIFQCFFYCIEKKVEPNTIAINSVDPISTELFTSLYPFLTVSGSLLFLEWKDIVKEGRFIWVLVIGIIFVILVYNSISYNFLFKIMGYNLYKIKNINHVTLLLITKKKHINGKDTSIKAFEINNYIYLEDI